MNAILVLGLVVAIIYLITNKWTWVFVSGLGTVASVFAMLASIIHFQILGAMGYVLLAVICAKIYVFSMEN